MKSHLLTLPICILLMTTFWGTEGQASERRDVIKAAKALREWQFQVAETSIESLVQTAPDSNVVRYLQAELDFHKGRYSQALVKLEGIEDDEIDRNVGMLRALAASSYQVTKDFKSFTSPGGHFIIYYAPGKDKAIVELSATVLESAYEALGDDLGHRPSSPIRVELLGAPTDLAQLSTLTASEIETTGTIALCKYGKLMIVSPRATIFGYPWMDTLTHEYVHYVVTQMSQDKVPVWMHEGLARFLEVRWRGQAEGKLSTTDEHLLSKALKKNALVSFDDMHPSMAKLPSQEAAALAFAEVGTMIAYIHSQVGSKGLHTAINLVRKGKTARSALSNVLGKRWKDIEKDWKKSLKAARLQSKTFAARVKKIRFHKGRKKSENIGVEAIANEKARKYTRLGGILRSKGKIKAAVIEYEKALKYAGSTDPLIGAKLGSAYLQLGRLNEAIAIVKPLLTVDEMDPLPPTILGSAQLALGDHQSAVKAFRLALRISPFDSRVRCGLAESFAYLKDKREAREREACHLLELVQ